ncbi:hypothetical protein HMPREF1221_01288 [Treponema socranskii subsp. paredis ATCC 35535]|nr:hypothetical protein HMPREF1221_01288 [Treponema socranskii subsp. paredis ATCC 35535]
MVYHHVYSHHIKTFGSYYTFDSLIGGARDSVRVILRYTFRFNKLVKRIVGVLLFSAATGAVHTVVFITHHVPHIVKAVVFRTTPIGRSGFA